MNISVIIINYNAAGFIKSNLNALINQTVKFNQIIVVDNHSSDNSIFLEYNSGYARGANIGISKCNSDLILVANTDIILDKDFNKNVIKKFEADKNISILSPLILRFDKKTVDSAGQTHSIALYPSEIGFNKSLNRVPVREKDVFSVCVAATVFKTKTLETLKINNEYYDEDFFIFWEDFDIGWRANLYGMNVHFYPDAVVYHYRSATLERNFLSRFSLALGRSPTIKYHLIKNRYLCLIKNFRFKQFWWCIPFMILKDALWVTLLTLSSPKIIILLLKSCQYIKNALKKRKIIKNNE